MATTFMNLTLPTVSVTLGPQWATELNAALELVDSHDHTSGKGTQIPAAGININGDLDFNSNSATSMLKLNLDNRSTTPSGSSFANSLTVLSGDLYYTNDSGVAVQVTAGGSIVSTPGSAQLFETQAVASDLVISAASSFVYLIVDTSLSRTITLPAASAVTPGRIYIIKDSLGQAKANNITVNTTGGDLVDTSASVTMDSEFESCMFITDGVSNWYKS